MKKDIEKSRSIPLYLGTPNPENLIGEADVKDLGIIEVTIDDSTLGQSFKKLITPIEGFSIRGEIDRG